MHRSDKRPSRARRIQRLAFAKRLFLFLAVAAVAGGSFLFLFRQKDFLVSRIVIEGNAAVAAADISAIADRILDGSYFGVIPKRAVLFYPRENIEKAISTIPWISSARVGLDGVTTIKIRVNERAPLYIWCAAYLTQSCYFMDAAGIAFAAAPEYSNNVFMRFYGPLEGNGSVPGKYLPEARFKELIRFIDTLNGISETVVTVVKRENDFELTLTKGGHILLPASFSTDAALSNLTAALAADPLKAKFKSSRGTLDYFDLRFGNKVFFKFKD